MNPRPAAPRFVQFYPTLRCDQSCGFCFNRGLPPAADVDPADFGRMLDSLQGAGVGTIDLLGGEPTLHPRLAELVGALAARGMRATLSTNGNARSEQLERLEDRFGPDTLRIGVSVNGNDPPAPVRDYIARRSPLVKSVCGRGWRLPPAAVEHLARPDAEYFLILRDPLSARDLEECVSFPEYREILADLQSRYPRAAGVACDGFVPDQRRAVHLREARCPAGTVKLSALPDGSVFPCYLLFSQPAFRIGNLLTDSFAAIWENPILEFFRTFTGNACPRPRCEHHAACHGGCPAVSLLVTGEISAPDPRCVPA